mgnify:CR=1 FL=1
MNSVSSSSTRGLSFGGKDTKTNVIKFSETLKKSEGKKISYFNKDLIVREAKKNTFKDSNMTPEVLLNQRSKKIFLSKI